MFVLFLLTIGGLQAGPAEISDPLDCKRLLETIEPPPSVEPVIYGGHVGRIYSLEIRPSSQTQPKDAYGKLRASTIEKEGSQRNASFLSKEEVEELERSRTAELDRPYFRTIYGIKMTDAIEQGYQVPSNSYFEITATVLAKRIAKELKDRTRSAGPSLLEPFQGIGQNTWAFGEEGFHVKSFELDSVTFQAAHKNFDLVGLQVDSQNGNGVEALEKKPGSFDAVFLDPPWSGNFSYEDGFTMASTSPTLDFLVDLALTRSNLVGVKLPRNTNLSEIQDFATNSGYSVEIISLDDKAPDYVSGLFLAVFTNP